MEDSAPRPPTPAGTTPPQKGTSEGPPEKSFGNMSDRHWSRAREGTNKEAVDYYRERSHAPGVAEGGGARNMYCMQCDGVIPLGQPLEVCPHCRAPLEGDVKRYFNWVEIDRAPTSDLRALRPLFLSVLVIVVSVVGFVWWLVARGSSA